MIKDAEFAWLEPKSRITYEDDEHFNGFIFGKRDTGTFSARIYDKTIRAEQNGEGYWPMIWGESFDPAKPVLRVEFEINRSGLHQFGLSSTEDVLDAAGALWQYLTAEWLTQSRAGSGSDEVSLATLLNGRGPTRDLLR